MNPETPEEWKLAVTSAHAFLLLSDARDFYGIIEGGPGINRDRCLEIIEQGAELGYTPDEDEALQLLQAWRSETHALRRSNVLRRMRGIELVDDDVGDPIKVNLTPETRARAEELSVVYDKMRAEAEAAGDLEEPS